MPTLLLSMAGRASPSATFVLSQDRVTEVSAGFDPFLIPLMLVVAGVTALTLKIVGLALTSIAGAFKSVAEAGLAVLAGLVGVMILITFALAVVLRSPT